MLGALDYCEVSVEWHERCRTENHIATLLPPRPYGTDEGYDKYNSSSGYKGERASSIIAWWSNMRAETAEDVAKKLDEAAETC